MPPSKPVPTSVGQQIALINSDVIIELNKKKVTTKDNKWFGLRNNYIRWPDKYDPSPFDTYERDKARM